MSNWKAKEIQARRAIEDRGFRVHDANIVFGENCQNIDLIVYAKNTAQYIQVKSSENPASKDGVVIDGSPWTDAQLYKGAPIFNKHDNFQAKFVVIVDKTKSGETNFYIAPPADLEALVRERALEFAKRPKRNNKPRSIKFRKELPRDVLARWHNAWHLLGEAPQPPA
jgi:Holliday junction resolvase-like predicted endonuclease